MPGPAATAAERAPRRARYLIPVGTPRRGDVVAAIAVVVLLAHLLFAQLTIALSVLLAAVGRVSRWRPQWLAVPAGAGLIWVLAIGPAAALAGFIAGPRQVAAYLGGIAGNPGRLLHLGAAFTGLGQWLPRQLPLALVLAAAEAAAARWLSWLHTDEQSAAPPRPGLVAAARRRYAAAAVRSGGVVTRDGGTLGIDQADGGRAAVSWRAASGGVLVVGAPGPATCGPATSWPATPRPATPGPGTPGPATPWLATPRPGPDATSFQLVHAAIRRRKPVVAVDLTGSPWLAGSLDAVCGAADARLYQFGEAGPACYEPLRGRDPVRAAAIAAGMLDWTGTTDQHRRACAAYLGDVFAVLAIAPGDPREPVLDDVRRLLSPAALRARLGHVPGYHPQAGPLADRVAASASLIEADPAALSALAAALTALRGSAIGRWLGPGSERISLGQVVRERAVGLFTLDSGAHGPSAAMIARLVAFDAMTLFAELADIPVSGDGLAWFNGCETLDRAAVAELVARGARAGMTVLLTTTSESAAVSIAGEVNVVAIHQLADPEAAGRLAALTGATGGGPVPPAAGVPPGPPVPAGGVPFGQPVVPAGGVALGQPAVPGGGAGLAPAAVPDWARRMPARPATGSAAGPGSAAAVPGPAGDHPFGTKGSPVVTADSLLRLREGAFMLVVRGPERRVLPRCQSVLARIPGRPA